MVSALHYSETPSTLVVQRYGDHSASSFNTSLRERTQNFHLEKNKNKRDIVLQAIFFYNDLLNCIHLHTR